MDNTITVVSEAGTSAIIDKMDLSFNAIRSNVPTEPGGSLEIPEPSSAAAALVAATGLLMRRRARRATLRGSRSYGPRKQRF